MKTWKWAVLISIIALAAAFVLFRQVKSPDVQEAEKQLQTAKTAIYEQEETIKEIRTASYRQIKKAVKQAVEKADSISDDSVCAEFNAVISGARERNSERRRSDSAD